MKSLMRIFLAASFGWLSLGLAAPAAAADAPIKGIVFAQPFRLDQPYTHQWRKEQPQTSSGYIIVLEVDPAFVRPQQVAEPVLYVGDQTAERINAGDVSGKLVVLVPGPVDLARSRIWFGSAELPEQVDAATVRAESAAAMRAGIQPVANEAVQAALRRGGKALQLANREALERRLAQVVQQYSPAERDLIKGLSLSRK